MENRILIVDDEERMCDSLGRLLSKEGYAVITASNGSLALEEAGREPVDVAIIDVKMPEMDGVTLLRSLKKHNPDLGVVMMTTYGDVDTYLSAMNLGAFEYLMKPINFDELKNILARLTKDNG